MAREKHRVVKVYLREEFLREIDEAIVAERAERGQSLSRSAVMSQLIRWGLVTMKQLGRLPDEESIRRGSS